MFGHAGEFRDRAEAGRRLGEALAGRDLTPPVVLYALPRGGVAVAVEAARSLKAPVDLLLVRKIPAPGDPELALGAVAEGAETDPVINADVAAETGASDAYLKAALAEQVAELERRRRLYLGGTERPDPRGATAVVVDDGLATGATASAAAKALRARGAARVVLAAPVAARDSLARLRGVFDGTVCLLVPERFFGVGVFYRDFHQLSDEEVVELLRAGRKPA